MRRLLQAAAAFLLLAAVSVAADTEKADAIGFFTGVASADAYRVTVAIPDFLIVEKVVDGGGPAAQAAVDSGGSSVAYAAAPDPGETVVSLPGLLSIVTGTAFPFAYPLYVSTQYPTHSEDSIRQPGYEVAARSEPTVSAARARYGESSSGLGADAFADAHVVYEEDGTVVATSKSSVGSFRVGVLEISGFKTMAKVTRKPNEEPVREVSMDIGRITIAGVTVAYNQDGFTIAGQKSSDALGTLVKDLLEVAGVSFEILEPMENADGVVAPGLRISTSVPVENIGSEVEVEYVLGRASVAATTQVFGLPDDGTGDDITGSIEPPVTDDGFTPPVTTPVDAGTPDLVTAPAPVTDEVAAPDPAPNAANPQVVPVSIAQPLRIGSGSFYLVLLGASALLAVMSRAFTSKRRVRWNS